MSCDATSASEYPAKHPSAQLKYGYDFERELARRWEPFKDFAAGVRIRVYGRDDSAGFEHECSGGRTGAKPPRFAITLAGTSEQDGSCTWTARAISSASLIRTITATPTWEVDSGVTVTDEDLEGFVATAQLAGGDDGTDYDVAITAPTSDGQEIVGHMVLPVRVPVIAC